MYHSTKPSDQDVKIGQHIYVKNYDNVNKWYIIKATITQIQQYTIDIKSEEPDENGNYIKMRLARYSNKWWDTNKLRLQKVIERDMKKL